MSSEADFHRESYPFDPVACVETTRATFEYRTYLGAGGSWPDLFAMHAEQRFLPGQVEIDERGGYSLPPVTQALPMTLWETPTSREGLGLLRDAAASRQKLLGPNLDAEARSVKNPTGLLVTNLSLSEITERLRRPYYRNDIEFLQRLKENGHFILPGDDTLPSTMVLSPGENGPWPAYDYNNDAALSADSSSIVFSAINLDELERRRPGLVGERLTEWHRAYAQADFAMLALQNLTAHERPIEAYVPRFLLKLLEITNETQREVELRHCHVILGRLATIANSDGDLLQHYGKLHHKFYHTDGPLNYGTDQQGKIHISNAIDHLRSCMGSNFQQFSQMPVLDEIREQFIVHPARPQKVSKADRPVIINPKRYLYFDGYTEIRDRFLQRHKLSLDDFAALEQDHPDKTPSGRPVAPPAFNLLANLVLLTHQKRANIFSEVQRALVEDLYSMDLGQAYILGSLASVWARLDARQQSN